MINLLGESIDTFLYNRYEFILRQKGIDMGEKNIRLVALDMDGTLLKSNQEVSPRTREAIAKAQEKGVHVMLCTGRWLHSTYPYVEELNLKAYIVTSNGGQIWTAEKKLIEENLHDPKKVEKMWEIGHSLDVSMWMVSTVEIFHEGPENFMDYDWLKVGYHTKDLHKLEKVKEQLPEKETLEVTNSSPYNIEVNPVGVNKANAIQRVCDRLDITMDEVMAVGDSLNDIKMIQEAGIGVAMGNAQEIVKETADFVSENNEEDGVGIAIERYVL